MSSRTDTTPWRLDWHEDLSVCVPEIDAEHRRFIRLVNDLNEAIIERLPAADIRYRMKLVMDDAAAHFSHEEALFRHWRYPQAHEHARIHAQIMLAMRGVMAAIEHGGSMQVLSEGGQKIRDTLVTHLLKEDMKYRDFCCAEGGAKGPGGSHCPG